MSSLETPWRFEIPWPRPTLRIKAVMGLVASVVLAYRAAVAVHDSEPIVFWIAVIASAAFLAAGLQAWRRLLCGSNPVILDDRGLSVDNGLGEAWFIPWSDVERVMLRRGFFRRWVVVQTRVAISPLRSVSPDLFVGLPPQWLAGLIETFREHFQRRSQSTQ
jgi:hypothetical protein